MLLQPSAAVCRCPRSNRRYPEEAVVWIGRVAKRLLPGKRGLGLVLAEDVDEVERVRGRLDIREVQLAHLPDRVEDGGKLRPEALDLVVRQREPRQPRDVPNLLLADRH